MDIKTYDLIIDTKTKHTALQVKDSFAYAVDNFTEPKAIYDLMTDGFRLDEKADEYVVKAIDFCPITDGVACP